MSSAAVLFQHPDTIHLRGIDAPDAPACQAFQIEVGESLVRAVILRAHETVELAVIHRRQPFLAEFRGQMYGDSATLLWYDEVRSYHIVPKIISKCFAVLYIMELGAKVFTHKSFGSGY